METSTITLEQHQAEVLQLKTENSHLKEQLELFKRQIFGKRSERIVNDLDDKQLLFEGFETPQILQKEKKPVPAPNLGKPI